MIFVCYPRCSTCQKAKEWLIKNNFKFEERHIVENNPTYEELKEWVKRSGLPIKKFFNTSGLLYKSMELSTKVSSMSDEEKLRLLSTNGMLVKRPLIISDNVILVGFKENEYIKLL